MSKDNNNQMIGSTMEDLHRRMLSKVSDPSNAKALITRVVKKSSTSSLKYMLTLYDCSSTPQQFVFSARINDKSFLKFFNVQDLKDCSLNFLNSELANKWGTRLPEHLRRMEQVQKQYNYFRFSRYEKQSDDLTEWLIHFRKKGIPAAIYKTPNKGYALWVIGKEETADGSIGNSEKLTGQLVVSTNNFTKELFEKKEEATDER